jgi:hypothetical protein
VKNWPAVAETPAIAPKAPTQRGARSFVTAGLVLAGLLFLSVFSGSHIIFAIIAIPVVVALAWSNPQAMLGILPVWMVAMGLIRRLTPGGGNVTFSGDPVLIIGPAALLVMWLAVSTAREPGRLTPLARAVLFFNVIAFVEAFNPKQGSILTGVGGLLFLLVPTAAFWIGRRYAEPDFVLRIIWEIAILGLIAAAYGLYQQFAHFPSWDASWIQTKGYTALSVGNGVTRAFSTFSSGQEYAVFLSVSAVAWVALLHKKTRWPLLLHLSGLTTVVVALWYEAQRTSVFLFVLALGVMFAARMGMRPVMVLGAGVAAVFLLITFAGALGGGGGGGGALAGTQGAAATLNHRQVGGISNPTGPNSSFAGHKKATIQGMKAALKTPEGHGTGSVTRAASKYTAKNQIHGSEFDPGNMGIAFGIPGLLVYFALLFLALSTAYRLATRRRDTIGMFVIGILAATLLQWTNGDLYAVCFLVWLFLGFADRLLREPDEPVIEAPEPIANDDSPAFSWRKPGESRPARA